MGTDCVGIAPFGNGGLARLGVRSGAAISGPTLPCPPRQPPGAPKAGGAVREKVRAPGGPGQLRSHNLPKGRDDMDAELAQQAVETYVAAFNGRDMSALGTVLSEDVSLLDWEVSAVAKVPCLRLRITVKQLVVDLPCVAADLVIRVNDETELDVLDLFEFNEEGLIKSVRAFKGPERRV